MKATTTKYIFISLFTNKSEHEKYHGVDEEVKQMEEGDMKQQENNCQKLSILFSNYQIHKLQACLFWYFE